MTTLLAQSISMGEALSVSITGIIVVMIILALLAIIVVLLSKAIRLVEGKATKQSKSDEAAKIVPAANSITATKSGTALPESQSAGSLDLYKTDEKTAAVIMAIVSNESGIPLNRLQFNSIKLIEE